MTDAVDESAEENPPEPVQKQTPGRAVQETAPGVLTSAEVPREATLNTGDLVGGRFVIVRYLGSSGGGVSYLSEDTSLGGEVVIKVLSMPEPSATVFGEMAEMVRTASTIEHRNLTKIIGMGRVEDGRAFVAMEFIRGTTLSAVISRRREEGAGLSVRDTFTVLAHVCRALEEVHPLMHHGVLTPYNIYIDTNGVVKVGNLAFGRIAATYLHAQDKGPFVDSVYVAPEAAESPELMSDAADIYSLGMVAAEMLSSSGLPADRDEAKAEAIMMLSSYPAGLSRLISTAIGEDLAARPRSAQAFRERFHKAVRDMGVDVSGPSPEGGLVVEPAVQGPDDSEENLFDIPELASLSPEASDPQHERYLVQRGGLDYGPFTAEQVVEQLHRDEIDEFTAVLDRVTQHRVPLGEMDRFKDEVERYIPIREERRRKEAEARAELERKVKKTGYAGLAMGIAVGIFFLVSQIVYLVTRPDPTGFPIQEAFAEMDYKFLPPPKEFTAVAVDKDLLQSIFNPEASEEEIEKAIKKRRRKRGKRGRKRGKPKAGANGVTEVDMSAGSGSKHILTDGEVNDVILANFGGLRSCILRELKTNKGFRGVTVQFFIRPTGTTGGVKIKESKYAGTQVGDCLTSRFRSMKFPEHGGFNRGVTYPLRVQ
jgi:serine/threonine protein kinase